MRPFNSNIYIVSVIRKDTFTKNEETFLEVKVMPDAIDHVDEVFSNQIGPLGYTLQGRIDDHHGATLEKHRQKISEINQNLRFVINEMASQCKKLEADPDKKPPYDLRGFEDTINRLEDLYHDYRKEAVNTSKGVKKNLEKLERKRLFPEDLSKITEGDMKSIIDTIDKMQTANKDKVQEITQELYLVGQLFITITDIIRKMDETHRRFLERVAEKLGR